MREQEDLTVLTKNILSPDNENNSMDINSIDTLRKITFSRLVETSKKYSQEKLCNKNAEALDNKQKTALKLYENYRKIKSWQTNS